jgi:hypothetical protein
MISVPGSGPLSKNPGAAAALLHQLEQRRLAAMWANDAGALGDILAKTMIYIHESGRLFHREEYLAAIADGVATVNSATKSSSSICATRRFGSARRGTGVWR